MTTCSDNTPLCGEKGVLVENCTHGTPAVEAGFELDLSMTGNNGHTEMSFSKDQVRVTWRETNAGERDLIRGLVKTSKLFGFTAHTVDADGNAKDEAKTLPGIFRGKKGELILKGEIKKMKLFAQEMIAGELKEGRIVLRAKDDGQWEFVKAGEEVKAEPGKKEKVVSSERVGGG
jgi:hypothetical protein